MNRIITILTVTTLTIFSTFQLQAQKGEHFKSELNLTEKQTEQFKAVKEKYKPELKAIRQNDGLSNEDKKKQVEEIKTKMDSEVKIFLSDDQYAKIAELRKERKEGRGKLKKELNLTDDQAEKMDEIRKKYKPQIHAVKEDSSLSEKDKKTKIKALKKTKNAEIKEVLSDDQFKKLKEFHKEKKGKRK